MRMTLAAFLVLVSSSALAQVGVQVGPGGVSVETQRERQFERRRPRCREVRTRRQMPDGSVRTVIERRCR